MMAFFLDSSNIFTSSLHVLILKLLVTVADMSNVLLTSLGTGLSLERLGCAVQRKILDTQFTSPYIPATLAVHPPLYTHTHSHVHKYQQFSSLRCLIALTGKKFFLLSANRRLSLSSASSRYFLLDHSQPLLSVRKIIIA